MSGRKKFKSLIASLPRERRVKIASKAAALDAEIEMTLKEMREHQGVRQEDVADSMSITQPVVSRMEKQDDTLISSLRNYVHATGAELEIFASFPDGQRVKINQFGAK